MNEGAKADKGKMSARFIERLTGQHRRVIGVAAFRLKRAAVLKSLICWRACAVVEQIRGGSK
jgi:hypothetical protein